MGGHWNQQHHLRRLSPLGSEQQKQHYHQYSHSQTQPPSSSALTTSVTGSVIDYYNYCYNDQSKANTVHNDNINTAQQQQQPVAHTMFPPVTTECNVSVGSIAVTSSLNSTTTSLLTPRSPSVLPYNYYNYQLPTTSLATNPPLFSASYNNVATITSSTADISATSLMNATRMGVNNDNSVFPSAAAAAAVAALQRPLPTPYSIGNGSTTVNITTGIGCGTSRGFSYHQPALPTQQQQFYLQRYQQQISTLPSTSGGKTDVGTAGVLLQQQQQLIANRSISASLQSPLPLSSPSILSMSMNNSGIDTSVNSSIAITNSNTTNANYFHKLPAQQQQLQLYQQQQSQLYQQQQQPQLCQQQSHLYHQQQPLMYQQLQQQAQLTNIGQNTSGILHYPTSLQQHQQPSQLYQTQHQLQSNAPTTNQQQPPSSLSNNSIGGNNYYQQLPQCQPSKTITSVTPNNASTMAPNNYYFQQPSMATTPVIFNQHQQQPQYYQQQIPAVTSTSTPVINLLDDDLQISGPPPIQPEKISVIEDNDNNTTTLTANIFK